MIFYLIAGLIDVAGLALVPVLWPGALSRDYRGRHRTGLRHFLRTVLIGART